MSAEAIGRHLPAVLTLDGLAAMNGADTNGYRYEMSPDGALSVMPPPGFRHAVVATRLMGWLIAGGWPLEQILQAVGLRIRGRNGGDGGRIPDLVVWGGPPVPDADVWVSVTDVALVVEIISPSSKATDKNVKRDEYAGAGLPRYWTVDCDPAQTVTMYELAGDTYKSRLTMPLDWVLNTPPSDYLS